MSTTADDLKAEFKTKFPEFNLVAEKFLGISEKEAKKRYWRKELPFPVVRIGKTQRAKLLVNVDDLAEFLDKESLIAREQM